MMSPSSSRCYLLGLSLNVFSHPLTHFCFLDPSLLDSVVRLISAGLTATAVAASSEPTAVGTVSVVVIDTTWSKGDKQGVPEGATVE